MDGVLGAVRTGSAATDAVPASTVRGLAIVVLGLMIPLLLGVMMRALASILQPLFVAVFLCYLILPAHNWLVRHRVPSPISYVLIVGGTLAIMYGIGNMVYASFDELWTKVPAYGAKLETYVRAAVARALTRFPSLEHLPLQDRLLFEAISSENITRTARATVGNFINFLSNFVVVSFYLLFLMIEARTFRRRVELAFGPHRSGKILAVVGTINGAIAQYVAVKTFVSLLVAGSSMLVLWAFGVDFFVMWGILTFVANFIPYIGSLVVATLPVVLAFLQFDNPWRAISVAVLLVVVQQVCGYYLEPRLTGRRLGVSPLMILLALAFWGWLWGVTGMILAVPLVVMVKIILENIEPTRPLAVMISNL